MSFEARFSGDCAKCDERIKIGDLITDYGQGVGYQHAVCPEDQPTKPTRFEGTTLDEMGF